MEMLLSKELIIYKTELFCIINADGSMNPELKGCC